LYLLKETIWKEISYDANTQVILFDLNPSEDATMMFGSRQYMFGCHEICINVFYGTDTVGIYPKHPGQDVTQVFHHNVDILRLEETFQYPVQNIGFGYGNKWQKLSESRRLNLDISRRRCPRKLLHLRARRWTI